MPTNTKNAPGGGVTAPHATEGVRSTTNAQKEIVMTNDTPRRPWLDEATAAHLTESDLVRLDAEFTRWSNDDARFLGGDLVDYIRNCALDQAKVRRVIGPAEISLPEFATVHKHSEWELTEDGMDAVRYIDAIYADANGLDASLEVDQYASTARMDMRVRIGDGITDTPADLTRWALKLLELADAWTEILKGNR